MKKVKIFLLLLCLTAGGSLLGIYNPKSKLIYNLVFRKTVPSPSPEFNITTKEPHLCSCECCLTEDQVLVKHRLDTFGDPFLSKNSTLSADDHKWWTSIQPGRSSFSSYQSTVRRLFELIPPVAAVAEPRPDRCRTCAVVGNSPTLKGTKYGQIIDSKDVVIRMNHGVVKGFETDVGRKTTHRTMFPGSAENLDNDTHLVFFAFKLSDLQWLIEALTTGYNGTAPGLKKINANRNLIMVLNPAFIKYVHQSWLGKKGKYPSSGILSVILAQFMCDEVHVFGFGADSTGRWTHYWEPPPKSQSKVRKGNNHPVSLEYEVLEKLDEEKRIQFYHVE